MLPDIYTCSVTRSCPTLQHHGLSQAPLSMGFSRQEYWSGLPFPLPDARHPTPNRADLYDKECQ